MHRRPIIAALLVALAGCREDAPPAGAGDGDHDAASPRRVTANSGNVKATLTLSRSTVRLDRDMLLALEVTAPSEIRVTLPELGSRLGGFLLSGAYDDTPAAGTGQHTYRRHARLTPIVADEYRIAPVVIAYLDQSSSPPRPGWFTTPPVVLDPAPLIQGAPASEIVETFQPVWIRPSAQAVLTWVLLLLVALAAVVPAWHLARRIKRRVVLARMSPRERALHELQALLARHLVEQDNLKDFYIELTMVVRRYIERQHRIRAPEQTTEEFLAAVRNDARFDAAVVARLRAFLESSDLVKFAAHRPDAAAIADAVATARNYVNADADRYESAARGPGKER
jgi:hypothetical protein